MPPSTEPTFTPTWRWRGRVIEMNDEDYFEHGKLAVKSLSKSVKLAINADLKKYHPQSWWQKSCTCATASGGRWCWLTGWAVYLPSKSEGGLNLSHSSKWW